ncbi:transporter substrate-binding domain-containing protein [Roseibium sediminicola]|uniref:Transporter substrate-binding domain-containing protein n=1 Tax=Roseibium sediminicola TaxID=2933272 RepID=A0ABT0H2N5_9HYPH|nr:transporter substrate-binding domain-containing protein [Roseibium sp. CAU 1639]MCK7615948.1 transporter substrate-binding domain-containing protein [Roseibium sp. CAU 1639]
MKIKNCLLLGLATMSLATSAALAGEDLDRVMEEGVLRVATEADWVPQSFLDDNNEMAGFNVDVAREIARRLGVEVAFVTPAWEVITAGNWNNRWDISVGSMTPTEQRAKVLNFPAVYCFTPAVAVVHADSTVQEIAELNDQRIGAVAASTFELYLQHDLTIDAKGALPFDYQINPGEIRSYPTSSAVYDDLRLGDGVRLDALIDAMPAILAAIENSYPLRIVGDPVFYEPLAIAIDRGDQEFNDELARIVADMRADGTLTTISEQWYGIDYSAAK